MSNNSNKEYDILLTIQIVLVILKMFNLIEWSWWMVGIPTYISLALTLFYVLIGLFFVKKGK